MQSLTYHWLGLQIRRHRWLRTFSKNALQRRFCPAIESYSARHDVSNKVYFLWDNAPSHPMNLDGLSADVGIEYISKNTISLLQPIDDSVMANFNAYQTTYQSNWHKDRDIWKKFNIMDALDNIGESWDDMKPLTLNCISKSIWPGGLWHYKFSSSTKSTSDSKRYCNPWKGCRIWRSHRRWCEWAASAILGGVDAVRKKKRKKLIIQRKHHWNWL